MELYTLKVFLTVANEGSFSRAAEKLLRTQPAISLAVQRLEAELGEKLIDRSGRDLVLTDAGEVVLAHARRFENLAGALETSLTELRDKTAGRLTIGANESTALYLLRHIRSYRQLYPKIKVQVQRALSSRMPQSIVEGDLELGVISYDPYDPQLWASVIYIDHLCFVVSPVHRLASRDAITIKELGSEIFIAHNVVSPYRDRVLQAFQRNQVPLNMDVEMPTIETIRRMVQENEGVAFLPKMCVEQDLEQGSLREIPVEEIHLERKIYLVYPRKRAISHAARAFLDLVQVTGEAPDLPAGSATEAE